MDIGESRNFQKPIGFSAFSFLLLKTLCHWFFKDEYNALFYTIEVFLKMNFSMETCLLFSWQSSQCLDSSFIWEEPWVFAWHWRAKIIFKWSTKIANIYCSKKKKIACLLAQRGRIVNITETCLCYYSLVLSSDVAVEFVCADPRKKK